MNTSIVPLFRQQPVTSGGIHIRRIGVGDIPPHEDAYLLFLFTSGHCRLEVAGHSLHISSPSFAFIHPGQEYVLKESNDLRGWLISAESFLLPAAGITLFKSLPVSQQCLPLEADSLYMPEQLTRLLFQQLQHPTFFHNDILHSLFDALLNTAVAGYPADQFYTGTFVTAAGITGRFKAALADKGRAKPTPESIAWELEISAGYLNECVTAVTGHSVSWWLADTVLNEAKRMLYYTALHLKEIAYELGFEDDASFSRFFKKHTGILPLTFRDKFRA
ncbi:AraC family transcriptional regulator [Chitinophaga arvensicola]|uniref:AraC-type DNA-binding protein n=1 Tax=Chitinophaga arvensicola TaxID=29529 RepID=A0A1I0SCN0_9BACT|nr:AraC family transcriptional regulator [Chitinophaga arvensicola]SEW54964.1 AraC-type DNA-binding protein [Chitinophaga arvensicola]